MAQKLPYVHATKLIGTVLEKILEAPTPPKFTIDFLKHKLGIKTSSARAIPSLLIKLGFLSDDRKPTETYNEFRNASISKEVMANAIKTAFKDLYECSEYAHDLTDSDLKALVIQITGLDRNNSTLKAIVGTFKALKEFADFETFQEVTNEKESEIQPYENLSNTVPPQDNNIGMNLAYTINLNLPETTEIEVFNAIFKSLKENLL